MKKTAIFKAIMALFVIMLGINFNADAQIGKNLLDKAKKTGNNAVKEAKQETSSNALKDKATDAAKGAGEGAIKDKWEKETADLFLSVDSTSSITDVCRAFYYAHKRYNVATNNGNDDPDFLLVYTDRVVTSYLLAKAIKRNDFLNAQKALSYSNPYDKMTMQAMDDVDSEIFNSGKFAVEVYNMSFRQDNGVPLPYVDLPAHINGWLDRSDRCKTNEAKYVCLHHAIVNREKYTVEFPAKTYPTDENMYTARLQKYVATLPADILAENPLPEIKPAAELVKLRIANVESKPGSFTVPASRDAALEATYKKLLLAQNPSAKVIIVAFPSDATAEWNVVVNAFGTPLERTKKGYIVVEYPGKPALHLERIITVTQTYQSGKYGASDPSFATSLANTINEAMIFNSELGWFANNQKF